MTKKKREETDILAGGVNNKKIKIIPKDPFEGKYGEIDVEVGNMYMGQVMEKLFNPEEPKPFCYEIRKYTSQYSGVAKTLWGETMFEEECRLTFTIIFQKGKKEQMIELLTEKLPDCCFVVRKE